MPLVKTHLFLIFQMMISVQVDPLLEKPGYAHGTFAPYRTKPDHTINCSSSLVFPLRPSCQWLQAGGFKMYALVKDMSDMLGKDMLESPTETGRISRGP